MGIGAIHQESPPPFNPIRVLKQKAMGMNSRIHAPGSRKKRFAFFLSLVSRNCPMRKIPVPISMAANPRPTA